MTGEKDLSRLLKAMNPKLHEGDYVFCATGDLSGLELAEIVGMIREQEAITIIIRKELADQLQLDYSFISSWITLTVHSSLEAVGLTAAFSKALADQGIGCNVVSGYFHDHIFVDRKDAAKAMDVLKSLSK